MPLRVELWVDGAVKEGADDWWDPVESALPRDHSTRLPLISRIDPYDDAVFPGGELDLLAREFAEVYTLVTQRSGREFLQRLIELCERGTAADNAELRFIGD